MYLHGCPGGVASRITPMQEEGGSVHFQAHREIWLPPGMAGGAGTADSVTIALRDRPTPRAKA